MADKTEMQTKEIQEVQGREPEMTDAEYRTAYEKEHLKSAELASRIADLEAKNEELEWKLNRIKKNPLWKASKPARNVVHWAIRQKDRLANCGGPRTILPFAFAAYSLQSSPM